jgi:hypothetical protein
MSTSFSLDDIRAAAEAKYGSTEIDLPDGTVVSLVNPLRLPKLKRDALSAIGERLEGEDVDQAEVFADAIRIAASNAVAAEKLIELCSGDLAILSEVFAAYTSGVQVGEASASQD